MRYVLLLVDVEQDVAPSRYVLFGVYQRRLSWWWLEVDEPNPKLAIAALPRMIAII